MTLISWLVNDSFPVVELAKWESISFAQLYNTRALAAQLAHFFFRLKTSEPIFVSLLLPFPFFQLPSSPPFQEAGKCVRWEIIFEPAAQPAEQIRFFHGLKVY